MKKYVITFYSVDGPSCEDDGFLNCANGGLYSHKLFSSREEAVKERDRLVDEYLEDMNGEDGCYSVNDGYEYEVGEMTRPDGIYIDWYYNADIINELVINIDEVEE